jgi:hypothetical protein
VRLQGPGVELVGLIRVDMSRPDVANAFHNPNAEQSGYLGTFRLAKMPPGTYQATVYRRSGDGWIGCLAKQPLTAP